MHKLVETYSHRLKVIILASLFLIIPSLFAQFDAKFNIEAQLIGNEVKLDVTIPANHYLYVKEFKVTDALGNAQKVISVLESTTIIDPNTGKSKKVFNQSFKVTYAWKPAVNGGEKAFVVEYLGCNDKICFMPQSKRVELAPAEQKEPSKIEEKCASTWQDELKYFQVLAKDVGYKDSSDFRKFLDIAEGTATDRKGFALFLSNPLKFVKESGLFLTIIFILIGGLALNLTPCVLPMIPINLAIIGAGAQSGSKKRGFALGAVYGLGIALVYGLLGVAVVLTGSQFGTIQSSPWFNLVIAVIFIILALAMFDLFFIDFSRFQTKLSGGKQQKKGSFIVAFTMGSVAALLAGACVAPVVIAVLLLATNLYETNAIAGLSLPFLLGLGMALPWPFAGAGLSFLPKPGMWMTYVKYTFGVIIILFAIYYMHLSYQAFKPASSSKVYDNSEHIEIDGATNIGFAKALKKAKVENKMVFIDFRADWCKNCLAMEKKTFKDAKVKERLNDYIFIKYHAEDPGNAVTKSVMNHFAVKGLPTFVVLGEK